MLNGEQVTLDDMLACREKRAMMQEKLQSEFDAPVLSFSMNIPGPVKTTADIHDLYIDGRTHILDTLSENSLQILKQYEISEKTGDELMMSVEADPEKLKALMTQIEETHPLGRLFDIDIIGTDGKKLSRPIYRKCFICGNQAQDCARSRRHTVEEMQDAIVEMLDKWKHN